MSALQNNLSLSAEFEYMQTLKLQQFYSPSSNLGKATVPVQINVSYMHGIFCSRKTKQKPDKKTGNSPNGSLSKVE